MFVMSRSRAALAVILTIAALHAIIYIVHERPEWNVSWTDQGGYRLLAEGLTESGQFTRYPGVSPLVPEAIRTPGYPLFVAAIFTLFGDHQLAVAIAQAALFVVVCLLVYRIARMCAPEPVALTAAALTAIYSPLPYFAALLLTELWTTFVLTAAIFCFLRAMRTRSAAWAILAGFGFAYTTLSRPVFLLLPLFLVAAALLLAPREQQRLATMWAWLALAFVLTMAPWFAYTHRHFGGFTISPAGGIGRAIWEGSWQGVWPGRVQADLTRAAETPANDAELAVRVREIARQNDETADAMLTYVRQWRDIRSIWMTPDDPRERVDSRVRADGEYLRVGLENIKRAPMAYAAHRVLRAIPVLWAADIPLRQTLVPRLPTWVIRLIWLPQAVLVVLAIVGTFVFVRAHQIDVVVALAVPVVYVTAVHCFFLTEARQSLPAKPSLIVLAAVGIFAIAGRQDRRAAAASAARTNPPTV